MIEFELKKTFKADFIITDKEILELPEEYQIYYKTLNEIRMLREQRQELFDEYNKKIDTIKSTLPDLDFYPAPPEGYYTATQISYIVKQNRSLIGKLTGQLGLKSNAKKCITNIDADGVTFKYYYDYQAVITIGDFYKVWSRKPNEKELKILIELLQKCNEFNYDLKEKEIIWIYEILENF